MPQRYPLRADAANHLRYCSRLLSTALRSRRSQSGGPSGTRAYENSARAGRLAPEALFGRPPAPAHARPQGGPLTAFGRRRLSMPPDGGMTAFGPRLSLARGLIRGRPLALRAAASVGSRKPAQRLSTHARPPARHGFRSSARPRPGGGLFPRRDRLLVPDCDRGLNSHRVSLRRSPDCFKRIRSRGRKRAARGSCQ